MIDPNSKYCTQYCEEVIALGREGKTIYDFAAHFNVCYKTLYVWAERHEEFRVAFSLAKTASKAWLTDQVRNNLRNGDFQVKGAEFLAKFIHQMTDARSHKLDFKPGMSFLDKTRVVDQALADGRLTADEAAKISQSLANGAKVEENEDLRNQLREIKELLEERGVNL